MSRYMLILPLVKRKPGALLPLEVDICATARRLRREFHGFELAKSLADGNESKRLTAYGTLYRGARTTRSHGTADESLGRPAGGGGRRTTTAATVSSHCPG